MSARGEEVGSGTSRRQSNYEQHLQLLSTEMYIDNNRHNAAITTPKTTTETADEDREESGKRKARQWFRPLENTE